MKNPLLYIYLPGIKWRKDGYDWTPVEYSFCNGIWKLRDPKGVWEESLNLPEWFVKVLRSGEMISFNEFDERQGVLK